MFGLLILLPCSAAPGQQDRFDAASIKPAPSGTRGSRCTGGPGTSDPGMLRCENYSLSFLVMMAYNLHGFQLKAPSWMDSARFNLEARIPAGADRSQFERMQQALLGERFSLQAHFEKKDMTVYDLKPAKGGAKLKPTEDSSEKPAVLWKLPAGGPPRRTTARLVRRAESMPELADFLSNLLGQPVTDATSLMGRYDYQLTFMMEPGGHAVEPDPSRGDSEFGVSIFDALKDQLGLALDKRKGDVSVLIVDHVEKVPSGN